MINNEQVTKEMANITYKNNINVGKATVLISGINNYIGEKELTFNILQKDISKLAMTLSATSFVYSGSAQKPTVKIGTLKSGVDYSVTYKNNINTGKASVTATGKGNYKGSITKTFIIKPPKATIVSFTPSKKSGTVKWKKNTQGTGYQISYANNSSFSARKT